jgi:hypothetical protein
MMSLRKLVAAFCLVAILAMAMSPVVPCIFLALLVPLFFFVAPVSIAVRKAMLENEEAPAAPFLAVLDSRGPPSFPSLSL